MDWSEIWFWFKRVIVIFSPETTAVLGGRGNVGMLLLAELFVFINIYITDIAAKKVVDWTSRNSNKRSEALEGKLNRSNKRSWILFFSSMIILYGWVTINVFIGRKIGIKRSREIIICSNIIKILGVWLSLFIPFKKIAIFIYLLFPVPFKDIFLFIYLYVPWGLF